MLTKNLEIELVAAESEVNKQAEKLAQLHGVNMFIQAPDVYIAASALIASKFSIGKGDRTALLEIVLDTDPTQIPDLSRKLKLITLSEFQGIKLYNDKCPPEQLSRKMVFRLWLHLVRKTQFLTLDWMIDF